MSTTERTTVINGYLVTLDPDMDGDGIDNPKRVTGCWIEKRVGNKTFVASLALLQDLGHLEHSDSGEDHDVAEETIEAIAAWAEANGY